jgi:hypothetical protein
LIRFPLLPTLLVAAAVATLIALGFWQVRRAGEKDALRVQYERNVTMPTMALPPAVVADETLLYRRATAFCLEVTGWRKTGGKAASGTQRHPLHRRLPRRRGRAGLRRRHGRLRRSQGQPRLAGR